MPIPSLRINDFSRVDPMSNALEGVQLLRQGQAAYDYFADSRRRGAERESDIAQSSLNKVRLPMMQRGLEANPDLFTNQFKVQNLGSQESLKNIPLQGKYQRDLMGSQTKDIREKEASRPMDAMVKKQTSIENLSRFIQPEIVTNPDSFSDNDVEDLRNVLGVEVPGWEQFDATQKRALMAEGLQQRRQAQEQEMIRRATLQHQLTPPQVKGQPFGALDASGKPVMFQNTDRGAIQMRGISPLPPTTTPKTTVRTLPDGTQQEVLFDQTGKEISTIDKGKEKNKSNTLKPTDITKLSKLGQNAALLEQAATAIESLPDDQLGPIDARMNQVLGGNPAYNEAMQKYNYVINQIRNELFGSALTANEQAAFEKMAATPTDFSEARFKQNTRGLANLVREALNNRVKELEQTGYSVPENLQSQSNVPRGTIELTSQQAEQALASGQLKAGDKVVVDGVPYTVQEN